MWRVSCGLQRNNGVSAPNIKTTKSWWGPLSYYKTRVELEGFNLPNSVLVETRHSEVVMCVVLHKFFKQLCSHSRFVVAERWSFEATMQIKICGNFLHLPNM